MIRAHVGDIEHGQKLLFLGLKRDLTLPLPTITRLSLFKEKNQRMERGHPEAISHIYSVYAIASPKPLFPFVPHFPPSLFGIPLLLSPGPSSLTWYPILIFLLYYPWLLGGFPL